jgi:asparagine synthase (glutamine-hydrolysing)
VCGIAGILDFREGRSVDERSVVSMTEPLTHRGPDAQGVHVSGSVGLGHRRLSIIDLAGGAQPMSNEDGRVWTVLNGEIYNFAELRQQLQQKGHRFATQSDTEVIVHQYEEDGPSCVERFRGMFSLAVWDERSHTLTLARDRFGKKPLFLAHGGDRLAFASEMKALLTLDWVDRSWSPDALSAFFLLDYAPAPLTPYKGIRKLEAGSVETWTLGRPGERPSHAARRYWIPMRQAPCRLAFGEARARLLELLEESVRLRLRSDVPLGAFLSGGVDSSVVVALMRLCGAEEIQTFSIGFESATTSELPYARQVAESFHTDHHTQVVTAADAAQLGDILQGFDEPFGDDSVIPMYFVSRLARERVVVALSGDGGDELFAGYGHYRRLRRIARAGLLPLALRRSVARAGAAVLPEHARGSRFLYEISLQPAERYIAVAEQAVKELAPMLSDPLRAFLRESDPTRPWMRVFREDGSVMGGQLVDQRTYLTDDILVKVDRCSMAVSLEARAPLLDHKVAEFANSLPTNFKLHGDESKRILKSAMRPHLPRGILDRPKQGFGMPLDSWLRGPLRDFSREMLLGAGGDLFDVDYVSDLLEGDTRRHPNWAKTTWAMLSLATWAERQRMRPW